MTHVSHDDDSRSGGSVPTAAPAPNSPPPGAAAIDIRIDWDVCMGSGNCVFLAPNSFDLADDGHAVVLDPTATPLDRLIVTAEGCPVGAISVWRGGQRLDGQGP